MSIAELKKIGAEVVGGIVYLKHQEVGRFHAGDFIINDAGRDALKPNKDKLAARKAAAEDVPVRTKPRPSPASGDVDLDDIPDLNG